MLYFVTAPQLGFRLSKRILLQIIPFLLFLPNDLTLILRHASISCLAIGIADVSDDTFVSIFDIVSLADKHMYEDKVRIKKDNPAISVR